MRPFRPGESGAGGGIASVHEPPPVGRPGAVLIIALPENLWGDGGPGGSPVPGACRGPGSFCVGKPGRSGMP